MDHFFQKGILQDDDDPFLFGINPVMQSSFTPYTSIRPRSEFGVESSSGTSGSNPSNMNKRMIWFMRRSWLVKYGSQEQTSMSSYRQVIRERSRRIRERAGYLALLPLLPPGTKNVKNSIAQMAVLRIEDMKRHKETLKRRNKELEAELASMRCEGVGTAKIRFEVTNPTSGVDSVLAVLKCLKSLGLKTTIVRTKFSDNELSSIIHIELSEIESAEVEKAVEKTLQEVEMKFRCH